MPYIRQIMPSNIHQYMEPFGGGGSGLLGMPPSRGRLDIYNDYDRNLVNLFLCVRDRPLALIRELGFLPLNSRTEFDYLVRFLKQQDMEDASLEEEMEIARQEFSPEEAEQLIQILRERAALKDVRKAAAFFTVDVSGHERDTSV